MGEPSQQKVPPFPMQVHGPQLSLATSLTRKGQGLSAVSAELSHPSGTRALRAVSDSDVRLCEASRALVLTTGKGSGAGDPGH